MSVNPPSWQASSYSGSQKPHQRGVGPVSSQNLLVCVHSLICTDRHPHQIWLRKRAGVCKTSYRPTCSAWYQRRHEHHCQRAAGLSFLGDGSAAGEGWCLQVPNVGGFTAQPCLGERLGNLTDRFLTFTALCSVSLRKGHPHEHQHSIISGPSGTLSSGYWLVF